MASATGRLRDKFPTFVAIATWPFRHWRAIAVVTIVLVIAHTILDQVLLWRLAVQREAIRAAGGAVSFADLDLPELDMAENAAISYRYANATISRIREKSGQGDLLAQFSEAGAGHCMERSADEDLEEPLTEAELMEVGRLLNAMEPAFDVVREAQGLPGCLLGSYDSSSTLASNVTSVLPELAYMRNLARHVAYRARWEASQGNVDAALELVAVGLRLINDLESDPLLTCALVRMACAAIPLNALQDILCETPVPERIPPSLLNELAAVKDRAPLRRVFEGERCFAAAMSAQMGLQRWRVSRPLFTLNEMKSNNLLCAMGDIVIEPDTKRREELLAPVREFAEGTSLLYVMARLSAPAYVGVADAFERLVAQADLAQVALALKAYHASHGAYPEELAALVPAYLKDLPADTFSGDALQYRIEGAGFVLYSIGQNRVDDAGDPHPLRGDLVWCAAQ